jgi:hypothetical protein
VTPLLSPRLTASSLERWEWLDAIMCLLNSPNYGVIVSLSLFAPENARWRGASELLSSVVVDTTPGTDLGEVAT